MMEEFNAQEIADIAALKIGLEEEHKRRMDELDKQNAETEKELELRNKQLHELSAKDKAFQRKLDRQRKIDNKEQKRQQAAVNSEDATKKLLDEFNKGFGNLDDAFE